MTAEIASFHNPKGRTLQIRLFALTQSIRAINSLGVFRRGLFNILSVSTHVVQPRRCNLNPVYGPRAVRSMLLKSVGHAADRGQLERRGLTYVRGCLPSCTKNVFFLPTAGLFDNRLSSVRT